MTTRDKQSYRDQREVSRSHTAAGRTPHPVWEAVEVDPLTGREMVVGVWEEKPGTKQDERWVRECHAEWHPGTRLRVTRYAAVTEWQDD